MKVSDWVEFDTFYGNGLDLIVEPDREVKMVLDADATLMRDRVLALIVRSCFKVSDPKTAVPALRTLLQRRRNALDDVELVKALGDLSIDILHKIASKPLSGTEPDATQ